MSIFKRTQRKYVKKAYRVRNWREYEAGLRNRGSLTVWISLTAGKLVNWDAPRPRRRQPGRQRKYSNHAIETAVTLGMVFHLSSRQSEGLLRSLFALMKLDHDVPDHTTISRRKPKLGKVPFYQVKQKTPLHILLDSSGLAVHAGQLRRAQKSRDYRKLHLCVDEQSGEVVAGELTSKRARDSSRVASLVGQSDSPISSARADTAYDAGGVYEAIENHSAHCSPRVLIPPRKGALLASGPASSRQRNRNIAAQARLGKRKWHTESGYSKRSKVETTFHRYKAIVGSAMRARGLAAQRVEARIGCKILNTMTALGMPDSEMIGWWESGPSELSASIGVVHQGTWARTMFDLGRSDIAPQARSLSSLKGTMPLLRWSWEFLRGREEAARLATPRVRQHHLHASPVLDIPHTVSDMRFATHTPTAKDHARRAVTDAMLAVHLDICCATNEFIHPMGGRR